MLDASRQWADATSLEALSRAIATQIRMAKEAVRRSRALCAQTEAALLVLAERQHDLEQSLSAKHGARPGPAVAERIMQHAPHVWQSYSSSTTAQPSLAKLTAMTCSKPSCRRGDAVSPFSQMRE
jgi:hypothetical protein